MSSSRDTLEYEPTWVVAVVCTVIVAISLAVERFIHYLGKFLKKKQQDALVRALEKLKEELMLLGFISLLLTVFQGFVSHVCVPESLLSHMLPCEKESAASTQETYDQSGLYNGQKWNTRRLLSEVSGADYCASKNEKPLLSLEGLHQLHIFIFVLAVVHVIFSASTMVLGGAKIREWNHWEKGIQREIPKQNIEEAQKTTNEHHRRAHNEFVKERAVGFWSRSAVVSWIISFVKQFHDSVSKSDYRALRAGFIMTHNPRNPEFDFHNYMMRALEDDFKKVVGISWYLWLFVVIFLLLNVNGWHTYFWLSFLPLLLLLIVGAKLEHIITRLAQEVAEKLHDETHEAARVRPSDEHFWFRRPRIILYLIHFILFQNSFEIAFFFWIWVTASGNLSWGLFALDGAFGKVLFVTKSCSKHLFYFVIKIQSFLLYQRQKFQILAYAFGLTSSNELPTKVKALDILVVRHLAIASWHREAAQDARRTGGQICLEILGH